MASASDPMTCRSLVLVVRAAARPQVGDRSLTATVPGLKPGPQDHDRDLAVSRLPDHRIGRRDAGWVQGQTGHGDLRPALPARLGLPCWPSERIVPDLGEQVEVMALVVAEGAREPVC